VPQHGIENTILNEVVNGLVLDFVDLERFAILFSRFLGVRLLKNGH
jgi:hypothetical protein